MPLFKSLFFYSIISLFVIPVAFGQSNFVNNDGLVILNSSKDVEMGINNTEIYLVINEKVFNINNEEFQERYEIEYQQFVDSKGRMIISEPVFLKSNTISISLEDISSINIIDGELAFKFINTPPITFKDIKDEKGRFLLQSFNLHDLQKIQSFYSRIR